MAWKIIIILSTTILIYARATRCGYVSDDLPAERRRVDKKTGKDEAIWQSSPSGKPKYDHLLSIIVHAVCACFIYTALGANDISFMAALLFAANPVNNQATVWISGRHYAWCGLFMMMSMTCVWSAPFAMIAATVHPTAFFAPFGFIGSARWYLIFFLPIVWFIHYKHLKTEVTSRRGNETVAFDRKLSWEKLIIAIKIYGFYFGLCVVPFTLTFYHAFMQSGAGGGNDIMKKKAIRLDWCFWLGLSLIGYLLYSAIFNWTPISWGIFWYSCAIAPYLNLFRMQQEIAERYCYIANIGVMFALANILPFPVYCFVFGIYVARLMIYIPAYTDDYWLIEHSVTEDPAAWFVWYIRAHKRWQQQSYREALNMWVMAKMLSPKEFKILYNIAIVLKFLKRDGESLEYMKMAEANIIPGQEKTAEVLINNYKRGKYHLLI